MKNKEALKLHTAAAKFHGRADMPTKFTWALMRTMKKIEAAVIEPIREMTKPDEDYQPFDTARRELCEKTALKNDDGTFKIGKDGNYAFPGGKTPSFTKLQAKHKDAIAKHEAKLKKADEIMDVEYDGGLYTVELGQLPESGISLEDLSALDPMIKEEPEK